MGVALRPSQPLSAAPPSLLTRLPAPARALPRAAVLQGQPAPAWALHGRSSCRKDPPAAAWGPPRAAGWLSAPAGSLQGCRGSLLRACSTSCPPPPPPSSSALGLPLLLLPPCLPPPLPVPPLALAETWFPPGAPSLAEGLGCVLRWGRWSRLGPAGTSMGQPWPLLTETALQPLLPAPGHKHLIQGDR